MTTVSMVVTSIPPRRRLAARAVASVLAQTRVPDEIIVAVDHRGDGAAFNRDHGLHLASGEWVGFLDDDDELLPQHVERLLAHADATGADLVFPWFHCVGGTDPFPEHFGRTWTREDPFQTTITFLVRRQAALDAGGFAEADDVPGVARMGEDFRFVTRLAEKHRVVHLAERTWRWHHNGRNTSGRPWTHLPTYLPTKEPQ